MGADGHINIWRSDKVREVWPDADNLFARLPTHYRHTLDGVQYDHCYWGDNLYVSYSDPNDWYGAEVNGAYVRSCKMSIEANDRLHAFVEWLDQHATHWEVWT